MKTLSKEAPLNLVWITLEDVSPRFGCYGDPVARTPHIDRLAAEGVLYERAFSTAPVCAPSRCSVITGMFAASIGGHHMRTRQRHPAYEGQTPAYEPVPPAHVKCFTEALRAGGYYCTNNSKTDYQFFQPFTAWDECGVKAHWRHRSAGQPFFAVFNFEGSHESGMWPNPSVPLKTDPRTVVFPPYLPDTPVVREALSRHYDNLERVDAEVGRVLRELEEDGLADRTLVILWSDHGEGLPRGKRWLYDTGIRVPLIVRHPDRARAGERDERLVSMVDLGPTVLSVLGFDIPPHLQGVPFLGGAARPRSYVHATSDRFDDYHSHVRAVRSGRYKYLRNFNADEPRFQWNHYLNEHPIQKEIIRLMREDRLPEACGFFAETRRPHEELYDCLEDPWETRNLAADPAQAGVLEEMRAELKHWQQSVGDLGDIPEARLSEMMWPGGRQPVTEAPYYLVYGADMHTKCPIGGVYAGHIKVQGPAMLQLYTPTQGASMAWRPEGGGPWCLYTGALRFERGTHHLEAKAIRIGYKESAGRTLELEVS